MSIASLKPLAGVWDARFEIVSEAEPITGEATDTYRWLTGEQVMVHETRGVLGGQPVEAIEVFTASDAGVRSRSWMADGSCVDSKVRATSDALEIDGDTERFRGRFETPDNIVGEWQRRAGDDWRPWMLMRLDRRA